MKFSKFNEFIKHNEKEYCFNHFSGALIELSQDEISDPSNLNKLINQGLIINEDEENENDLIKIQYRASQYDMKSLGLTIINTQRCNFSCSYCYEKNKKNIDMAPKTYKRILNYIKSRCEHDFLQEIHLTVLGGEPLLAMENLLTFYSELKFMSQKLNFKYFTTLVTNGFLIDEHIESFHLLNIDQIQITLDGDKSLHNRSRFESQNDNTYSRIFKNIQQCLLYNYNTIVRYNLIESNKAALDLFIKDIISLEKIPYVYLGHIRDYGQNSCPRHSCLSRKEFSEFSISFIKKCIENNIPTQILPTITFNHCLADSINGVVVDVNGDIYKCWHHIGVKGKKIADITKPDEIVNRKIYNSFLLNDHIFEKESSCSSCKSLPYCLGGCPMERMDYERKICSEMKFSSKDRIKLFLDFVEKNRNESKYE